MKALFPGTLAVPPTIVILDDNPRSLELLAAGLAHEDARILTVSRPEDAIALVREHVPELLITDLVMPGMSGLDVLDRVTEMAPRTEVIVMTAHYTTETAVAAIKRGAADYLEKPVKLPVLRERVHRLVDAARLREQVVSGHTNAEAAVFEGMVARSASMWDLFARMRRVAPHFRSVLVEGETGTGKDLIAVALHRLSARSGPFVVVNCSAVVETLFESELFGHVRGAFTGADRDKAGLFEHADRGTLFLDEIGDMPLSTQAKLLRAVQNQENQRLGSLAPRKVDVRVIAATHRDLRASVKQGTFREDLYYRISTVTLKVPPLRDRPEDIPLLVRNFRDRYGREYGRKALDFTQRASSVLERYKWPGNVRELESAITHALMMATGTKLDVEDLPETLLGALAPADSVVGEEAGSKVTARTKRRQGLEQGGPENLTLLESERELIRRTIAATAGNQSEAARRLGVGRDALRYRMKRLGLL